MDECKEILRPKRLREIPKHLLKEIKRFVLQNRDKYPVSPGIMGEEIKKRFCVELSKGMIYRLMRPEKKRVTLPEDVVEALEKRYGSVADGIKEVIKLTRLFVVEPPKKYKRIVDQLDGMCFSYDNILREIRMLGYEEPQRAFSELFQKGFIYREGDSFCVSRTPRRQDSLLALYLAGLG